MNPTFDLLKEPWILVIRNGELREMNLRDVLCSAHETSTISDPLPIVEFGIYRFLVALVMDIYKFNGSHDLDELLSDGYFDPARIDDYFREYGHCFDLFNSERPFLQTANMDAYPAKPFSGLLPCVPSGTAAIHFHHFDEAEFGVSPAVATRLLTTIAPFMTAGGAGLAPSINGAPPWYVLINGDTLFHTICLNCFVGNLGLTGDAPPAWRNPLPPKSDGRCTKTSLLEALTWRPRQIQLIPGESGICSISGEHSDVIVRTMKFRAGASCDFTWTDPSVPYKITNKGPLVLRPQDGREIWRDTGPLALLNDNAYKSSDAKSDVKFARPLIIDQFQYLIENDYIDEDTTLSLTIYGMRTDMKMKVFEWQKEILEVPGRMVVGSNFAFFAQDSMDEAGDVEYALKKAIKHLYPRDGTGNSNAFDTLIANASRQYWFSLRSHYDEMLRKLAELPPNDPDELRFSIRDEWREKIRKVVLDVFRIASKDLNAYGENIQRLVEAEQKLFFSLNVIFGTQKQKNVRRKI